MPSPATIDFRRNAITLIVLAVITLILSCMGYWYYQTEKEHITARQFQTLAAIGSLKADQIQQWRQECLAEIERAAHDQLAIQTIASALTTPGNPAIQAQLRTCFQEEMTARNQGSPLLLDPACKLLFAADAGSEPLPEATRQAVHQTLSSHATTFSDFYLNPHRVVQIDLATPVCDAQGRTMAVLVIRHTAANHLYPLLQSWPIPSRSAETFLVRRDGDAVVFLSDLRHRPGSAVSLRLPLTEPRIPAAQAVLGHQGVIRAPDYRGVPVVSYPQAIADSPWFILAKIDEDEIFAEVRHRAGEVFLVTGLLILLMAGMITWLYRKRMIQEEQAIGSRFRAMIDASPLPMAGHNAQQKVTFCNAAFEQLFGYTLAEIPTVADWWSRAYPVDEYRQSVVESWQVELERARRTGSSFSPVEVTVRCKNGAEKIALVSTAPLSQSHEDDYVVVFVDITERKAAETRILRLSMLYAALSECSQAIVHSVSMDDLLPAICRSVVAHGGMKMAWIGMLDATSSQLRQVTASGSGAEYLTDISISLDPQDEAGRGPTGISMRENRPVWCQDFQHDPSTAPWHVRAKRFGWNSSGSLPLSLNGAVVGCLVIYSDLLHAFDEEVRELLLQMQANLNFALDHLAQEAERQAMDTQLHDALELAESGNRAKSEFLAVMSHELRTPLNGVLGCADLLIDTTLDEEQLHYAQMITDSGNRLLTVVNDILDFSSIERGSIALDQAPVVLPDLVESCCRPIRQALADKGLAFCSEIAADVPAQITGDAQRLRQIIGNLLYNAVKYTAKGSVTLRLALAPDEGPSVLTFAIADTGIGIAPEQLNRLFKPFVQADSTLSRPFDGAGLGLAISWRLAEAMAGWISVASTLEKGSTFTFHLPLQVGTTANVASSPVADLWAMPSSARLGAPVMVVDDERIAAFLTGKMLANLGYRTEFAANGLEAVEAYQPGKYQALIMDMQMPVMGGVEATRRIREMEAATGGHVPIIALTANVMPGDRELCLAAGMDDFLTKPFHKHEFATTLAACTQEGTGCPATIKNSVGDN